MEITNSSSTWERIGVFIGHSFRYRIDFFFRVWTVAASDNGRLPAVLIFRDKIHCSWSPWIFDKKHVVHSAQCTNPNWVKIYLLSICELHKNQNRCVIFPVRFFLLLSAYRAAAISHRLHRRFNCALFVHVRFQYFPKCSRYLNAGCVCVWVVRHRIHISTLTSPWHNGSTIPHNNNIARGNIFHVRKNTHTVTITIGIGCGKISRIAVPHSSSSSGNGTAKKSLHVARCCLSFNLIM